MVLKFFYCSVGIQLVMPQQIQRLHKKEMLMKYNLQQKIYTFSLKHLTHFKLL